MLLASHIRLKVPGKNRLNMVSEWHREDRDMTGKPLKMIHIWPDYSVRDFLV